MRSLQRTARLLLCGGALLSLYYWPQIGTFDFASLLPSTLLAGAVVVGVLAIVFLPWRRLAPFIRARSAVYTPHQIRLPRVVDGDTIDDLASGLRYRLANIDAPEMGDYARCASEHALGLRAKQYTVAIVANCARIEAKPIGRLDQYGRVVAFVLADGRDLGRILVERGLARWWNGRRQTWCGVEGDLARLSARNRQAPCRHCIVSAE